MSLNGKQESCALCHSYLFEEDDVVYCPECGAPHHRECWNSLSRCALEQFHGTENQYDRLKRQAEQETPKAEETEASDDRYQTPFGTFAPFDFLGGVPPKQEIEEGVTAKDAAKFVFSNTMRYIPKFAQLNKRKKTSWNFLAFFFPGCWMLSRKMYKGGIIACVIEVLATILTIPFQNTLANLGYEGFFMSPEVMDGFYKSISKINPAVLIAGIVGCLLALALSIFMGVMGDWIYRKHTINSVKEINAQSTDKETDYRKKGGVNIAWFFLGMLIMQYIPMIISMFI